MAVSEVQQLQNRLDALEERMFGAPAGAASAGAPRKVSPLGWGRSSPPSGWVGGQVSQSPSSPASRWLGSGVPREVRGSQGKRGALPFILFLVVVVVVFLD